MRFLIILLVCCMVMFVSSGCEKKATPDKKSLNVKNNSEVSKVIPDSIVGVWRTKEKEINKWGIKIEKDGSISKIDHLMGGHINLSEGGKYVEGPDTGTYCFFAMGPCHANYDLKTKILKVKIVVDQYRFKLPNGELEGNVEDYFEGTISDDGKIWNVNWRSYCWLDGASPPQKDIIDQNPVKLEFEKKSF